MWVSGEVGDRASGMDRGAVGFVGVDGGEAINHKT